MAHPPITEVDFFGQIWTWPSDVKRPEPLKGYIRDPAESGGYNQDNLSFEDWGDNDGQENQMDDNDWGDNDNEMSIDDNDGSSVGSSKSGSSSSSGGVGNAIEKSLNRKHGFQDETISTLLKEFSAFEERTINSDVAINTVKFLQDQFQELGLLPLSLLTQTILGESSSTTTITTGKGGEHFQHQFTVTSKKDKNLELKGINLVGCILASQPDSRGEKPSKRLKKDKDAMDIDQQGDGSKQNEIIVITAHYDIGEDNLTSIGNDSDNCSGVIALTALAQHFKNHPPSHHILFIATDACQLNQVGISSFLSSLPPALREQIIVNINLDILNRIHPIYGHDSIAVVGSQYYPLIKSYIEEPTAKRSLKPHYHDSLELELIEDIDSRVFHESYMIPFIHFGLALEQRTLYRAKKQNIRYESTSEKYFLKVTHFIVDVVDHLDKKLKLFHTTYLSQKEILQRENKRRVAHWEKENKEKKLANTILEEKKKKLEAFRAQNLKKKKAVTEMKSPNRRKMFGNKDGDKDKNKNKDGEEEKDEESGSGSGSKEKEKEKPPKEKAKEKEKSKDEPQPAADGGDEDWGAI